MTTHLVLPSAVSAPGKVLLAGGYLVLDRAYTGLVFGLSARIHVIVQESDLSEIVVTSPQFKEAKWIYKYRQVEQDGGIQVIQVIDEFPTPSSRNVFVETALTYALTYISSKSAAVRPTSITILADNDYYSQPVSHSSLQFSDFGVRLQDAHKTGLGSSAALVTALTAAVLSYYLSKSLFDISSESGKSRLHNLAQAAHCAAQGKVGSGFDVGAAVYGTCTYRRFSPSMLSSLGDAGLPNFSHSLQSSVESLGTSHDWDTEIQKGTVAIPKGMSLVMCDVDCGSQTVGMVKKVLQWRKEEPESAKALWDQLQKENELLAKKLYAGTPEEIAQVIAKIRSLIKDMGTRAGVPIEPKEQTELLDALTELEGVCGGVCPGAGGYDAVALLIQDDADTLLRVESFLTEWSASKSSNVKLLGVKGEMEGVRDEDTKAYSSWIK